MRWMSKISRYREKLKTLKDWDSFLLKESGLPGTRANLELAQAVADEADAKHFLQWLRLGPDAAPTNSPKAFLVVCGVVGLGKLLAQGQTEMLNKLRQYASDPRWRIREGVTMALQRLGDANMDLLLREMEEWSRGNLLEKRAAAAALCEPRLLGNRDQVWKVLKILDEITSSMTCVNDRRSEEFRVLRQSLGYCWSVAAAAHPEEGKRLMEKWLSSNDKDVLWIMKENLKKERLRNMDTAWAEQWIRHLSQ